MEFQPHFKRKRKRSPYYNKLAPFPISNDDTSYQGTFNGFCVVVKDSADAAIVKLHENGCFGKGSLSRGGPTSENPNETLLLGLEESCFLAYFQESLKIRNTLGQEMQWADFVKAALDCDELFVYKLAAYLYLKAKNWIVKSGIKFGGDFLIYKQSPCQFHASFLVILQTPKTPYSHYVGKNLKGVHRVAETSDKDVLLLRMHQSNEFDPRLATLDTLETLTIDETVIRRFNYTSFVQSKQKQ